MKWCTTFSIPRRTSLSRLGSTPTSASMSTGEQSATALLRCCLRPFRVRKGTVQLPFTRQINSLQTVFNDECFRRHCCGEVETSIRRIRHTLVLVSSSGLGKYCMSTGEKAPPCTVNGRVGHGMVCLTYAYIFSGIISQQTALVGTPRGAIF